MKLFLLTYLDMYIMQFGLHLAILTALTLTQDWYAFAL